MSTLLTSFQKGDNSESKYKIAGGFSHDMFFTKKLFYAQALLIITGDQLMYRVALQINELKSLVIQNKETLQQLRTSFEKPELMSELSKKLEGADNLLQRYVLHTEKVFISKTVSTFGSIYFYYLRNVGVML